MTVPLIGIVGIVVLMLLFLTAIVFIILYRARPGFKAKMQALLRPYRHRRGGESRENRYRGMAAAAGRHGGTHQRRPLLLEDTSAGTSARSSTWSGSPNSQAAEIQALPPAPPPPPHRGSHRPRSSSLGHRGSTSGPPETMRDGAGKRRRSNSTSGDHRRSADGQNRRSASSAEHQKKATGGESVLHNQGAESVTQAGIYAEQFPGYSYETGQVYASQQQDQYYGGMVPYYSTEQEQYYSDEQGQYYAPNQGQYATEQGQYAADQGQWYYGDPGQYASQQTDEFADTQFYVDKVMVSPNLESVDIQNVQAEHQTAVQSGFEDKVDGRKVRVRNQSASRERKKEKNTETEKADGGKPPLKGILKTGSRVSSGRENLEVKIV